MEEMKKKIEIIKDFAKKMGYTVIESEYEYKSWHGGKSRPSHWVELLQTSDVEGNPYSWGWYLDTGEEIH